MITSDLIMCVPGLGIEQGLFVAGLQDASGEFSSMSDLSELMNARQEWHAVLDDVLEGNHEDLEPIMSSARCLSRCLARGHILHTCYLPSLQTGRVTCHNFSFVNIRAAAVSMLGAGPEQLCALPASSTTATGVTSTHHIYCVGSGCFREINGWYCVEKQHLSAYLTTLCHVCESMMQPLGHQDACLLSQQDGRPLV